jgi:hypothetical protein
MLINREDFARDCADQAFRFGVNSHYLLAVAELLSEIKNDRKGKRIGPFRVTQADWNSRGSDEAFEVSLQPAHIKRPGLQCVFAALQTLRAQEQFQQQNGGDLPTATELYAIWPNQPLPAGKTLQAALDSTRDLVEPAEKAALEDLDLGGPAGTPAEVVEKLRQQIIAGKIIFDSTAFKSQLLGLNNGTRVTAKLQSLVLKLSEIAMPNIRISSLVRTGLGSHHTQGRAVDIGNDEIAGALLPIVATDAQVALLEIDELIFDGALVGQARNKWNYDEGRKHDFTSFTLDQHGNHIHFSVKAG